MAGYDVATGTARSMTECRRLCRQTYGCQFVVYSTTTGECVRKSNPLKGDKGSTAVNLGWTGSGGGVCFVTPSPGTFGKRVPCALGPSMGSRPQTLTLRCRGLGLDARFARVLW